jgi:hypothetical protein
MMRNRIRFFDWGSIQFCAKDVSLFLFPYDKKFSYRRRKSFDFFSLFPIQDKFELFFELFSTFQLFDKVAREVALTKLPIES